MLEQIISESGHSIGMARCCACLREEVDELRLTTPEWFTPKRKDVRASMYEAVDAEVNRIVPPARCLILKDSYCDGYEFALCPEHLTKLADLILEGQ